MTQKWIKDDNDHKSLTFLRKTHKPVVSKIMHKNKIKLYLDFYTRFTRRQESSSVVLVFTHNLHCIIWKLHVSIVNIHNAVLNSWHTFWKTSTSKGLSICCCRNGLTRCCISSDRFRSVGTIKWSVSSFQIKSGST